MSYLTLEEYKKLGFAEIEEFSELKLKAEMAVDLYTNYFYQNNNLEDDFDESLTEEGFNFYNEESIAFCGLDDFEAFLKAYHKFMKTYH